MLLATIAAQAMTAPAVAPPVAATTVTTGAAAGPPAPVVPRPTPAAAAPTGCRTDIPTEPGVITVCAPPPQGYRIDPDVIRAKKIAHNRTLPKKRELLRDTSCQVVGSMGCMNPPIINVVGAALTAVKVAQAALTGGNVRQLLQTEPSPSEYEIYLAAKADREAAEREQAAQAAALAAKTRRAAAKTAP